MGLGDQTDRSTPTIVSGIDGQIVSLATDSHTLALTSDGKLYSWELNDSGQLGRETNNASWWGGNVEYDDSPQLVEASFGGNRVVSVSASSNGSLAVTENGQLYVWGQNDNGNLGLGHNTDNRGLRRSK